MNSKLEAISTRLEHFVKHKDILGLLSVSKRISSRTITDSLVESVVIAREDDKEKLLKMILSDEDGNNNNIEADAFQADLKNKEQIDELTLERGEDRQESQDSQIEKDVLENLQPSTNLKKLNISCYSGTIFPKWLGDTSYSNVAVLCIGDCNYCLSLPPCGKLPSLKELVIKRINMVKIVGERKIPFVSTFSNVGDSRVRKHVRVGGLSFYDIISIKLFPALQHLDIYKCPSLEAITTQGGGAAPKLRHLSIEYVNNLRSLPEQIDLPALKNLYLQNLAKEATLSP
ncbi:hypothetical protein Fmac_026807 [Flemingia macrophylla]|uniref:R13L1/DRL21-like LRR repeat region domain-containing protein n=1 Tax=Flemingia macrophylla TaxID=520843 RepID=A0ABD1LGG2_9FABA